jgi:hypothetical protein
MISFGKTKTKLILKKEEKKKLFVFFVNQVRKLNVNEQK